MKEVTLWYKQVNGKSVFNHLDDDWKTSLKPSPKSEKFTNQKAWENDEWNKE